MTHIREKLEGIFDDLRSVGNDIPLSNKQCTILLIAGLESLDFGKVCEELLGPAPEEQTYDDDLAYDAMSDKCTTAIDGITPDLQAIVDEWEDEDE
jgi:hypothetical protein